jgi:hypothetical protein
VGPVSIELGALLEEMSTALSVIPAFAADTKRHTGLAARITPPCVLIEPRPTIDYQGTYEGDVPDGMDTFVVEVTALVALMGARSSWGELGPYLSRSGPSSIRDALHTYDYTTCSDVFVDSAELVVATYAGNQYLGATFSVTAGG